MNEAKHKSEYPSGMFTDSLAGSTWVIDHAGRYIAEMVTQDDEGRCLPPEQAQSVADLFAAAPDLLAACEALAECGAVIATTGLGDQLRAAITKAKGGEA